MVSAPAKRVTIKEGISTSEASGLAKFIDMYFVSPKLRLVEEGSYRKSESQGEYTFSWRQLAGDKKTSISVSLGIGQSVEASFTDVETDNPTQRSLYERTLDWTENLVLTYFQNTKTRTIYFVIGLGEEKHSEAPVRNGTVRNILRRIFSGNTTNAFLLFLVLSYALFFIVGNITVIVIIAMQLVYLFYADVISLNLGNVRPTIEKPLVAVIGVKSNRETVAFLSSRGKSILKEIRKEASHLVLKPVDLVSEPASDADIKAPILSILSRNGIIASLSDIEIKTRNVYDLVERVASKFQRPVPKIVISNSVVSNAMATGISTKRSSIMITAGSLIDLTDEELESVIGHELGHVKGHDPVILFGVSSVVYIGAFYFWYSVFLTLGLLYYLIAFGVIFAVGKVLETRADTESAMVLGNAQELATSLTKIGFRQLYQEKYGGLGKFIDWFRFDPHPPIYFRISRLSSLAGHESTIRHAFLVSLRDCISGFFGSI
jgi:heat shock protein HtpX